MLYLTCPERTKLPVTVLLRTASLMLVLAMAGVTLGKGRRKLEISLALPRVLDRSHLIWSTMNTHLPQASKVTPEP